MREEGGAGGRLGGEQDPVWACQGPGGKGLTIKVFAVSLMKCAGRKRSPGVRLPVRSPETGEEIQYFVFTLLCNRHHLSRRRGMGEEECQAREDE